MMKNKRKYQLIVSILLLQTTSAEASNKDQTIAPPQQHFDFYLLATEWIPGWCQTGTGSSGAKLNILRACQQQIGRPLMFHGLWPENNDGSYPSYCTKVAPLDQSRLKFANPYSNYLSNARSFIDHEWSKHGTCSTYYKPSDEFYNTSRYYQNVNNYFVSSIAKAESIDIPVLPLAIEESQLQQLIHEANPGITESAILISCQDGHDKHSYLSGIWFCVDKQMLNYIACPKAVRKQSCKGEFLTR